MNRKYHQKYYLENRDKIKETSKIWLQNNPTKNNRSYRKARVILLQELGSICVKCGFSDIRALQLDHILGNGFKHRKEIGSTSKMYLYYSRNIPEAKMIFQILCANCNWIKRFENGEHRKK